MCEIVGVFVCVFVCVLACLFACSLANLSVWLLCVCRCVWSVCSRVFVPLRVSLIVCVSVC